MNAPSSPPPPPPPPPLPPGRPLPPRGSLRLAPSFLKAWRGVWLFTWRAQWSWRRVPLMLVWLLILPFLIWITVSSPETWNLSALPLGDAPRLQDTFSWRLRRDRLPSLTNDQPKQLVKIIQNEYDRTQSEARRVSGPETSVADQKVLIDSCHQRIEEEARSMLDARQFAIFRTVDQEYAQSSEAQAGEPAWNRTAPFYRWLIDLYFFIILPFSCVRSCGGLIRDELQADTLGFLTTRPVKRATLVVLKYLSQVACLEMVALLEGLLLMGAGALREIPDLGSLIPLFLAAQFLAVPAWSALGLFLGQATKRYLPLAVVYGLVVELGIGDIPTNINTLSLMRHLKALLSHDKALQSIYDWTDTGVLLPVGALLLAAVFFVTLAALLFTFREYHAASEMQK